VAGESWWGMITSWNSSGRPLKLGSERSTNWGNKDNLTEKGYLRLLSAQDVDGW